MNSKSPVVLVVVASQAATYWDNRDFANAMSQPVWHQVFA